MTSRTPSFDPARLLVGFDFSPLSELALAQAASMASRAPAAAIHIVAVVGSRERLSNSNGDDIRFEVAERLKAGAESALRAAAAGPGVRVFAHVVLGDPAEEILAIAADVEADMIFVGTHGRHGVKRLLMGSVAEKVVRDAGCPVVVMRHRHYASHPELVPEPACPNCVERREATGGAEWWCEPHRKPWVPAHRYSYRDGDLHPYHPDRIGPA